MSRFEVNDRVRVIETPYAIPSGMRVGDRGVVTEVYDAAAHVVFERWDMIPDFKRWVHMVNLTHDFDLDAEGRPVPPAPRV